MESAFYKIGGRGKCKHIIAVELYIQRTIDLEGNITEKKRIRISYPQDWKL